MAARLLLPVLLALALAGCAAPAPRAPPDPAAVALGPADVGPLARVGQETVYENAEDLSEATPDWATAEDLVAWGFRSALARLLEERPDGPRVNHAVYVFNGTSGASEAYGALSSLFEAPPWTRVAGAKTVGDASTLFRLDTRGGSGFVLVVREGPVLAQILAVGETMDESRILAWGRTVAGRVP